MRFPPSRLGLIAAIFFLSHNAAFGAAGEKAGFRPALVGNGPKSLVNLIDTKKLVDKGQGDGAVMFDVAIGADATGSVLWTWCHASAESKALKDEVQKELQRSSFVPAMMDGNRVGVSFYGTVIFAVRGGHPYLRVFANQDRLELAQQSDFIGPQMLLGSSDWKEARPYLEVVKQHAKTGRAVLSFALDADGKVRDLHLVREEPTGLNIRAAALKTYATAKFIPAFRYGRPVACTFERDWAVRGFRYRRW